MFLAAPHARHKTLAHTRDDDRECFARTHYWKLYDDALCDYKRSFDYRHGSWYRRTVRLQAYLNTLDDRLDLTVVSRVVDNGFVDRITPVVTTRHVAPRDAQDELYALLEGTPALVGIPRIARTVDVIDHIRARLRRRRVMQLRCIRKLLAARDVYAPGLAERVVAWLG